MSNRKGRFYSFVMAACWLVLAGETVQAQVTSVKYGKNRIQHKKFNWRYYQTENFNVQFTDGGLELAKFVLQVAEEELPNMEAFTETALQRRANIVLYNTFDDMKSSNIGLGNDIADVGGLTRLVNNKMIVYHNGNHADLRRQIREGIARILVDNRMFGESIGEIAGNATLLDLPKWLTDGYVSYAAENWSIAKDDALKNALLARDYRNFYQLAFANPTLVGHAFWKFFADNYKRDNVTYFLYLAILYKNLNTASLRITKKRFKDLLDEFMQKETERCYEDIRGRRNYPKGSIAVTEDVNANKDFYHFAANPNVRLYTYAVAEYNKGNYKVSLYENFYRTKVLVNSGVKLIQHERNPVYPIMSWDGKGSRLAVVYWEKGVVKLLAYDLVNRDVTVRQALPYDQVTDAQYFVDNKKLVISAVKNGHSDIFMWDISTGRGQPITSDVWDDLDASFVSFPNKYGILFASNRPSPEAKSADTTLPGKNRFNIFLIDLDDKGGFRQLSQLTNLKYGNARYPMQYNMNHFTFVADENGVGNRYAGFFTTKAEGLDTLMYIGDEVLRNPERKELDSTLRAWERPEPDSIGYIAITKDSTYSFPITNYQSSLLETRIAGDAGMVSEVTQQSGAKMLYRLRVDSIALRRRNVNAKPTTYMRQIINEARYAEGNATLYQKTDTTVKRPSGFLTEFENDKDTAANNFKELYIDPRFAKKSVLQSAKLYKYKPRFSNDMILLGVSNSLIFNRYQPYAGGAGPIYLNNGNNISWAFVASMSDIMEDYHFTGAMKPGIDFTGNEYFLDFQNLRRSIDWGLSFYRGSQADVGFEANNTVYPGKVITHIYQGNVSYPFDRKRRVQLVGGYRNDLLSVSASDRLTLEADNQNMKYAQLRAEYVYDNSLYRAQNIWNGLRYKFYIENIAQLEKAEGQEERQFTFNLGADARYYLPIYRNFTWAVRGAFDASWGNQKLIYYLGGADSWISPQFVNENKPNPTVNYVYQSLAVNMRGYKQNLANGNSAMVINSELRLPIFTTFGNKPINSAFIRNFQLTQFIDLGSAWEGTFSNFERPGQRYSADPNNPVIVNIQAGGIGPFAGGYGFGARSTVLGYFLRVDAGWPMSGFFNTKPIWYFSLGLDF
jgi:hypothetical protein